MMMCTKNIFGLLFGILFLGILSSCSERAQCPAYINMNQGTLSVQDKDKTPEEIRKQSQKLLETQDYYIKVKRSKKTGLVKNSKKVKKGKNNTNRHTGFSNDPRTLKGVK